MRVFLVQTAHGLNAPSGGYRSNLGFIRQLGSYGHTVAQTCYGFDNEVEEGAAKAKAKGIDPEVRRLPDIDLGTDPTIRGKQQLRVTKFVDENRIINIVISRKLWEMYPYEEQVKDHKAYLEVSTLKVPVLRSRLLPLPDRCWKESTFADLCSAAQRPQPPAGSPREHVVDANRRTNVAARKPPFAPEV
jgi:hypothetical protein